MSDEYPFDAAYRPPAPVVPVGISSPVGEDMIATPMLVDTGADCTLIPIDVARQLRLPLVDKIVVMGLGGARLNANVHAATLRVGPLQRVVRVVALDDEAILGRDVLGELVLELHGPSRKLLVRAPGHRRPPARRVRRS